MVREQITKRVDDIPYEFSQFGAERALKLLVRLSKIVGKPLALAVSSAEGEGSLLKKQVNPNTLALAVEALMERLDESEAVEIIKGLTSGDSCMCQGRRIEFNTHYEGRLPHMFKVLAAALEVQYGNFFDALGGLPGFASRATTPAPTQSTGPSGAPSSQA